MIESCPPPGAAKAKGKSHTIKSHHNVGGLPKDLQFTLIEPLRELFKVRHFSKVDHVGDTLWWIGVRSCRQHTSLSRRTPIRIPHCKLRIYVARKRCH